MANLFIGGLAWHTQEVSLQRAFGPFGELVEISVIRDRDNPTRSKGYGFVKFATEQQAQAAIKALNGTELDGRTIRVDVAQENVRNRGFNYRRAADNSKRGAEAHLRIPAQSQQLHESGFDYTGDQNNTRSSA